MKDRKREKLKGRGMERGGDKELFQDKECVFRKKIAVDCHMKGQFVFYARR